MRSLIALWVAAATTLAAGSGPTARGDLTRQLRSRLNAADHALADSRDHEAAELYLQALEVARELGEPNLLLARAVDGLADARRREGRLPEAEQLYRRSSTMWEALLGRRQPRLATTLHNLGVVCAAQGKAGEAEAHFRSALEIWEATLGPSSPEAGNTRRALGQLPGSVARWAAAATEDG
jgi:tetratricopeptide (TPR) repeat protein